MNHKYLECMVMCIHRSLFQFIATEPERTDGALDDYTALFRRFHSADHSAPLRRVFEYAQRDRRDMAFREIAERALRHSGRDRLVVFRTNIL
ncbi:hypothetical protein DPMN_167820 [Dreissena polymorpha]|uniref:Uncharacterized protein n=1 Tax=Dreissena polymorpha TaxID=45954 RepID=A0A9D4IWP1_DREPO|nr:hypothetical protein DPMN_167820 [Dreissena polymorpha]